MANVQLSTLGAVIKTAYEGEANTNAFTDADVSKLAGIATGAQVNTVTSVNGQVGEVIVALPTVLSQFTNDVGFITESDVPTALSELDNDVGFITATNIPVQSVNGQTGAVTITATDVGLGNVDNTSDVNKPLSTATQTALNVKISSDVTGIAGAIAIGNIVQISQEDYDLLAPEVQNTNTFLIAED